MRLPGCTHDHPPEDILAAAAKLGQSAGAILSGRRKVHGAGTGRPGKPTKCPKCGRKHPSARAARTCEH